MFLYFRSHDFLKKLFCSHKKKLGCRLCLQPFKRMAAPSYSCLNQFADFATNFLDVELFGGGTGGSNYDTPPCVPCSEPEPDKKSSIYAVLAHFCVFCKKNPPCNCQIDKTGGNFL